jgi:hypothetical protein
MVWSFFTERGLLCFVSVTFLTTRISYVIHLSRSFSGFDLPRMGYPLRDFLISRVALFLSIPECVSLAYEHARPS